MMLEFDLKKALAGGEEGRVVTRNGDEVTGLVSFEGRCDEELCLYGVRDGLVESWTVEGKYAEDGGRCYGDLFMFEEESLSSEMVGKRTGWINLYDDFTVEGRVFASEYGALNAGECEVRRMATVKINW